MQNAREASVEYARIYPERRHPTFRVFTRLKRTLRETGQLFVHHREVGVWRRNVLDEERVLDHFEQNPGTSCRKAERHLHKSRRSIHRILKDTSHHPYHFRKVQQMFPQDYPLRQQFCHWILRNEVELPNILWTDESLFTHEEMFNVHDEHYWDTENPHVFREKGFQKSLRINVWAGLLRERLIAPHIIEGILNVSIEIQENNLKSVFSV